MIEKLQCHCLPMDGANPRDIVTLQVKNINEQQVDDDSYRVILDENPPGKFTMNSAEGCIRAKTMPTNKVEFVCIGR